MFTGIFHSFCYCKSVTRFLRTEAATRGVLRNTSFTEHLWRTASIRKRIKILIKILQSALYCFVLSRDFPSIKKSNPKAFHVSVLQFYLNYSSQLVWMVTVYLFFFQSCYVLFLKLVTLKVDHGRVFIKKSVFSFFCYLGVNCLPWAGPNFFFSSYQ